MKKQRFICKRCGEKFEMEVFEPGEAQERRAQGYPVQCPSCRGPVEVA